MDRCGGAAFGSRSDDPRVLTRPAPHPVARCRACSAVLAEPFCLCFIYLLLAVLWTAARAFGMDPFKLSPGQIVIALVGVGYLTLTHRRIYQERWTMATLKGIVVVVLGAVAHNFALVAARSLALVVT